MFILKDLICFLPLKILQELFQILTKILKDSYVVRKRSYMFLTKILQERFQILTKILKDSYVDLTRSYWFLEDLFQDVLSL